MSATQTVLRGEGDIVDNFITQVRHELDRQRIPIKQMCTDLEIGRPYTHRVLAGEHRPSLDWANRVADYLGLEIVVRKRRSRAKPTQN